MPKDHQSFEARNPLADAFPFHEVMQYLKTLETRTKEKT